MKDWLPLVLIAIFPLFFLGMWCSVLRLLSRIGGWAKIAEEYRAVSPSQGTRYRWRSMQIRPFMNYSSALDVTLSRQGVYLVPFVMFRIGHEPLLIPWSCVGPLEEKSLLFFKGCLLPIEAAGKRMRLSLPVSAREWLAVNRP
jgi:hypothetical protein